MLDTATEDGVRCKREGGGTGAPDTFEIGAVPEFEAPVVCGLFSKMEPVRAPF